MSESKEDGLAPAGSVEKEKERPASGGKGKGKGTGKGKGKGRFRAGGRGDADDGGSMHTPMPPTGAKPPGAGRRPTLVQQWETVMDGHNITGLRKLSDGSVVNIQSPTLKAAMAKAGITVDDIQPPRREEFNAQARHE